MATFKVSRIKNIPFYIDHENDEVLAEGLTRTQYEELVESLGYSLNKFTHRGNTTIYYKNRKNGIYITYQHTGADYYMKEGIK